MIREYLESVSGNDDAERSIEEFKRLSGQRHSHGWRFNRDEAHMQTHRQMDGFEIVNPLL